MLLTNSLHPDSIVVTRRNGARSLIGRGIFRLAGARHYPFV
jgi:hypothetical protein